jgi:hypothetical protein
VKAFSPETSSEIFGDAPFVTDVSNTNARTEAANPMAVRVFIA